MPSKSTRGEAISPALKECIEAMTPEALEAFKALTGYKEGVA